MTDFDWLEINNPNAVLEVVTRLSDKTTPVVPTGIPDIDGHMWYWGDRRGIPRGEYVVVGGASNSGKTMLGLYLTRQAMLAGERCAIISMDMRREDLLLRQYQALDHKVDRRNWLPSRWSAEHTNALYDAVARSGSTIKGSMVVGERKSSEFSGIQAEIDALIADGVTWILVDHLQKIRISNISSLAERVELIGEYLADTAFYNRVTICALSQLSATAQRDFTRSPTMYDLYGGTGVGSNASLCFVCDHTLYQSLEVAPHMAKTWVMFSKNRMGPKGHRIPILWNYAELTVTQAERREVAGWPSHQ